MHLPNHGGTVIYQYDIVTNTTSVVADFAGRLPWPGVEHVWTKSEGSPSRTGRYWGFMAEDKDFETLGFFTSRSRPAQAGMYRPMWLRTFNPG